MKDPGRDSYFRNRFRHRHIPAKRKTSPEPGDRIFVRSEKEWLGATVDGANDDLIVATSTSGTHLVAPSKYLQEWCWPIDVAGGI